MRPQITRLTQRSNMSKTKIPLSEAEKIANQVVQRLSPVCDRISVSGSIRRKKKEVGDIEIVCIPKITWGADLFGELTQPLNHLQKELSKLKCGGWTFIKNGPKYKQIQLHRGYLDLFIVTPPAQWGVIFAIRTGPASFSRQIVTQKKYGGLLPSDCKVRDGAVWQNGEIVPMPEEEDFLEFVGLSGLQAEERQYTAGRECGGYRSVTDSQNRNVNVQCPNYQGVGDDDCLACELALHNRQKKKELKCF